MNQLLAIHIGQCGLQIGSALWELFTFEHCISQDGLLMNNDGNSQVGIDTLFNECGSGHYVPRAVYIDLEPTVIDEMKNGSYRRLFHPDQLINGPEDAANNFARGFYNLGRLIKVTCAHQIRKEIEKCDNLQGIHLYRSLAGGTGSGVSAAVLEILSEFAKLPRLEVPIHPSPNLCSATVEPYNCILSEHFSMEDIDMSLLVDNEALYDIITHDISIVKPTLYNVNRILAQVCSSLSSATRYPNDLYNDFTSMTNLVPYPRIHFPLVSYAPFGDSRKLDRDKISIAEITKAVFWPGNQMVKIDPTIGRFMSCSLLYRGKISPTEIFEALADVKSVSRVRFVDWCPTGFKVGIVSKGPQILPDSHVGLSPVNVIMMTNNSAVSSIWHRLSQKFHGLYSKRSFVHWFVAEGLEENEFCEALYNIATLAKDYEEISLDTEYRTDASENVDTKMTPTIEKKQELSSPMQFPPKTSKKDEVKEKHVKALVRDAMNTTDTGDVSDEEIELIEKKGALNNDEKVKKSNIMEDDKALIGEIEENKLDGKENEGKSEEKEAEEKSNSKGSEEKSGSKESEEKSNSKGSEEKSKSKESEEKSNSKGSQEKSSDKEEEENSCAKEGEENSCVKEEEEISDGKGNEEKPVGKEEEEKMLEKEEHDFDDEDDIEKSGGKKDEEKIDEKEEEQNLDDKDDIEKSGGHENEEKMDEKEEDNLNDKEDVEKSDGKEEEEKMDEKEEENLDDKEYVERSDSKDEKDGGGEAEAEEAENVENDVDVAQENTSNIFSYKFRTTENKFKITESPFKTASPGLKTNCVNIKRISAMKNSNKLISDSGNRYPYVVQVQKKLKNKVLTISEKVSTCETVFNSNLFKKNFIKKCANPRRCLTSFSHVKSINDEEEGTQSLMEDLIKMTEKN